jgi:hypothetical protein
VKKSDDAVCIWLPEGGNGECTWVIPSDQIATTATASTAERQAARQGRYFSNLRPWSADCHTRVSIYDKTTPIKTLRLHVNTDESTVTRVDADGQTYTYHINMALPSSYSELPDLQFNEVFMLTTSIQLGGYAFFNRYNFRQEGIYTCSPYYD